MRTLAGQFEGHPADPLDFIGGVDLCINGLLAAVREGGNAAWFTEIDTAGQFANDHQVEAGDQFFLQAGGLCQCRQAGRRAKIGEQVHFLAEFQQARFRTQVAFDIIPFCTANSTEQYRIDRERSFQRLVSQRGAIFVIGCPTNLVFADVEGDMAAFVHPFDDTPYFSHHFRADAITRQDQQFFIGSHSRFLRRNEY